METQLQLGDITVDVVLKDIKNVHLSVYPPTGRVRISAPVRMDLDTLRVYAISKLDWIKRQQTKLRQQARETPRAYIDRESHYVWGQRYLLQVVEANQPPAVELAHSHMLLRVRAGSDESKRQAVVEQWYREQVKQAVPRLIALWEPRLGVQVERFYVQRMKTRWGSCNDRARTIRLNTELAKKPSQCLEYVVVHEMVHLLARRHDERFRELMDGVMPHWETVRDELNQAPLGYATWAY